MLVRLGGEEEVVVVCPPKFESRCRPCRSTPCPLLLAMPLPPSCWPSHPRQGTKAWPVCCFLIAVVLLLKVSPEWLSILQASASTHGATWLHDLHMGVILTEMGAVDEPRCVCMLCI
jgi:hypothetical protein